MKCLISLSDSALPRILFWLLLWFETFLSPLSRFRTTYPQKVGSQTLYLFVNRQGREGCSVEITRVIREKGVFEQSCACKISTNHVFMSGLYFYPTLSLISAAEALQSRTVCNFLDTSVIIPLFLMPGPSQLWEPCRLYGWSFEWVTRIEEGLTSRPSLSLWLSVTHHSSLGGHSWQCSLPLCAPIGQREREIQHGKRRTSPLLFSLSPFPRPLTICWGRRAADGQCGRECVRLEERREALLAKLDGKTRPPGTTRGETEDIEGEEGGRG